MRILAAALAALLALLLPQAAAAEERIISFDSQVAIQADGTLDVTETIHVLVENVAINRGIYRDFPTRYDAPNGRRIRVGFDLLGTWLDGQTEPAKVETRGNGVRIRIGSADRTVPPGEHSYVIRYRATRMIGRFDGYDELYWNVTGTDWDFPIDRAAATITLPSAARFGQRVAYTGPQGSTETAARVVEEGAGSIRFEATRPLSSREGLTVAAAFPKGIVAEQSGSSRLAELLSDYGPMLVGLAALLGLAGFYYVAWQRAGRDPARGTVVPIFSPPDGLSPAAMRYVSEMALDNRAFAAALVDMGVRGHIRMVEEDASTFSADMKWIMATLRSLGSAKRVRLERIAAASPLPPAEEAALRELARTGESIVMEQENHAEFTAAKKGLEAGLKREYEGKLFNKNWGWAITGVLLFFAALWLVAAAVVAAAGLDVNAVLVPLGAAVTATLLVFWIQTATAVGKFLMTGVAFVFAALAIMTGGPVFFQALATGNWLPLIIPALALPLVASAFMWIDAPTKEGRGVLDRVAGFKQYLSITERERLDRMTPPEDTPQLFERFLPYAIALGVENRWAQRFAGVLAAAATAPAANQGFGWYSGSSNPWSDTHGFVNSIGSSLASTISSASTAPGSSSGSGGGGFSGGGGGGGGGGGW